MNSSKSSVVLDWGRSLRRWLRAPNKFRTMPRNRPSQESIRYLATQLGRHRPTGLTHNIGVGYHELPFPGLDFPTSRNDLAERVERITGSLSVAGKFGLDVGCAIGGVTFSLQIAGARMVGLDRDLPSIQVARECEAVYGTGALFIHREFSTEVFDGLADRMANPSSQTFDFVVWLSSMNWVAEALGSAEFGRLLARVSERSNFLVADSAIGGKANSTMESLGIQTNQDFADFVRSESSFESANSLGIDNDWYGRELFLFGK